MVFCSRLCFLLVFFLAVLLPAVQGAGCLQGSFFCPVLATVEHDINGILTKLILWKPKAEFDTIQCHSTLCVTTECCDAFEVCDGTYCRPPANVFRGDSHSAILCKGSECTEDECCAPPGQCPPFMCVSPFAPVSEPVLCRGPKCTTEECCKPTCTNFMCGDLYLKPNWADVNCVASTGCGTAECCGGPTCATMQDCVAYSKGSMQNKPNKDAIVCAGKSCVPDECCVLLPTNNCANYNEGDCPAGYSSRDQDGLFRECPSAICSLGDCCVANLRSCAAFICDGLSSVPRLPAESIVCEGHGCLSAGLCCDATWCTATEYAQCAALQLVPKRTNQARLPCESDDGTLRVCQLPFDCCVEAGQAVTDASIVDAKESKRGGSGGVLFLVVDILVACLVLAIAVLIYHYRVDIKRKQQEQQVREQQQQQQKVELPSNAFSTMPSVIRLTTPPAVTTPVVVVVDPEQMQAVEEHLARQPYAR